jgi:hypothetical protein
MHIPIVVKVSTPKMLFIQGIGDLFAMKRLLKTNAIP